MSFKSEGNKINEKKLYENKEIQNNKKTQNIITTNTPLDN